MKKTILLFATLLSASAFAESKVVCQDSIYKDAKGNYLGMGSYDQAVKNINEELAKIAAATVSAPSVTLRENNSAIICVTVTK